MISGNLYAILNSTAYGNIQRLIADRKEIFYLYGQPFTQRKTAAGFGYDSLYRYSNFPFGRQDKR